MSVIPDSLKSISAYFKKADELEKDSSNNPDSKIVAYSCRFYAIEKATSNMPNVLKDPDSKTYLLSQMSLLEKEKTSITLSKQDRKLVCEAFAFKVCHHLILICAAKFPSKVFSSIYLLANILNMIISDIHSITHFPNHILIIIYII